jgi:hypothetical protein
MRSQTKTRKTVRIDEIQWMLDDAEQDGQALLKLSNFLVDHGYRRRPSSCDDAIATILKLERRIKKLSSR